MFDLWYATGAAIMVKSVFDEIKTESDKAAKLAGKPLFYYVNAIQFYDASAPAGPVKLVNPNNGSAFPVLEDTGFVVESLIDVVRGIIAKAVRNGGFTSAPPISLYTAGKFCQWLTVPHFELESNIVSARQGYVAAAQHLTGQRSANFPALLGALLIDRKLTDFMSSPLKQDGTNALAEFKINDPAEVAVVQALSKPANPFQVAQAQLLGNPMAWTSCGEQFHSWSPRTDALVV